ncbi:hypothetical protein SAMN05421831_102147 [Allopseudospirillum japonicum]|uniref:Uncharacterized protein n=2 Tax=Allopseudospirillum japonicum TaxID=64971 RepID=A0A1H6QRV8_9GAMM|nr:hypothetical protein SAMN05421831_102147 [Allopseudospirillum japonicum]
MVDMAKLKEEALKRKRDHEEAERRKQMKPQKSASSSARRAAKPGGAKRSGASAQGKEHTSKGQAAPKKKRSVSRWVLDILLFLGALLVLTLMFNPF